jgi:glyoxylate reductase
MVQKKAKILVTRRIPTPGIKMLESHFSDVEINEEDRPFTREELLEKVKGKDAVLCLLTDKIDEEVMKAAGKKCKIFSNYAVGFENIDIPTASKKKIFVTNTPDCLTNTTADMAIALLFAAARRIPEADRFCRDGKFKGWAPKMLLGKKITGKKLGIIGAGRIGTNFALKMKMGFRMKIYYADPYRNEMLEDIARAKRVSLNELLEKCDFVSIHTNYNSKAHHLIDHDEFNLMKAGAVIINTARGKIINEKELVKALKEKKIFAAGLDVFENEPEFAPGLTDLDNVVLAPHIGSASEHARNKMARMAAKSIIEALEGKTPEYCLNKETFEKKRKKNVKSKKS